MIVLLDSDKVLEHFKRALDQNLKNAIDLKIFNMAVAKRSQEGKTGNLGKTGNPENNNYVVIII